MVTLNIHSDSCPCESGKLIKDCTCLTTADELIPQPVKTPLPVSRAGFRHPKCYASAIGECDRSLSREHCVSQAILKSIGDGYTVTVEGFRPWIGENLPQKISVASFTAKVLCTRHNSALSPLDVVANRFFRRLSDAHSAHHPAVYAFNGHDIERWMLKCLCGFMASGSTAHNDVQIPKTSPPKGFLDVLYGLDTLPDGWGMYLLPDPLGTGIGFAPIIDKRVPDRHRVSGCILAMKGLQFLLAMETPPESRRESLLDGSIYRPTELTYKSPQGDRDVTIILGWTQKGDQRGAILDWNSAQQAN